MVMRMDSGLSAYSGLLTSPGTPEHGENVPGTKTWSSERVPFPARRQISAAALIPLNSGKALPSKWDDAERWITSPISGNCPSLVHMQRHLKSKSGPIKPTVPYSSVCTPAQDGKISYLIRSSPENRGELVPHDGFSPGSTPVSEAFGEDIAISGSIPSALALEDLSSETSEPASTDGRNGTWREEDDLFLRSRDAATQMSPGGSTRSSSRGRLSFSLPPFLVTSHENSDVRDVQVDNTANPSKGGVLKMIRATKNTEHSPSAWNNSETSKKLSKIEREAAKISAWEKLQKAKADAALRKLEMELEKKRSASMDRIAHRLRQAEIKAQAKRDMLFGAAPATSRTKFFGCHYFTICFRSKNGCKKS